MLKHPFIILFAFFSLIGILIATNQVQTPQIFKPKASVIGVSLSILPSTVSLDPGAETSFDIVLNPDGENVSAIELVLLYDQSVMQVTDIKPTGALPQALALDISQPGRASIILLSTPGSDKIAEGIVGKVFIKTLKSGTSNLKFDTTTKVSAVGKTGDVIGAVESAEVTVAGGEAPKPNINLSEKEIIPQQADELIKTYLETKTATQEASQSGGLVNTLKRVTSEYIQNVVRTVNSTIEQQAKRFLD